MSRTLELFENTIYTSDEDIKEQAKQSKNIAKKLAQELKQHSNKTQPEPPPKPAFKAAIPGQGWQILFTTTTRLHFLKIFLNWKKKGGTELPDEGLKMACFPDNQILYYYDFQGCHQYSKVMLQRLCDNSIERLERDYQRYIRMLANDNRVVGKLLSRSIARKVKWRSKGNKLIEEPIEEVEDVEENEVMDETDF